MKRTTWRLLGSLAHLHPHDSARTPLAAAPFPSIFACAGGPSPPSVPVAMPRHQAGHFSSPTPPLVAAKPREVERMKQRHIRGPLWSGELCYQLSPEPVTLSGPLRVRELRKLNVCCKLKDNNYNRLSELGLQGFIRVVRDSHSLDLTLQYFR